MKVVFLTTLTTILSLTFCFSQDVIIKKSGDEIKAKITEVGLDIVRYKKFDHIEGPIYTIAKYEILIIRYENGTKDIFNEKIKPESISSSSSSNPELFNRNKKAKAGLIIKAGLNLSNILLKVNSETYFGDLGYRMNPGFHIGATTEFPLTEMFSFETGLLLSTKGFKREEMNDNEQLEKLNLLYLDIPLTIKASFDLGGTKLCGIFGPYLGVGLSGRYEHRYDITGMAIGMRKTAVEWGYDLERLDYGLTMGAGVEVNSIQISLTYSLGLANLTYRKTGSIMSNGTIINLSQSREYNNRVLGISVGYRFRGK